MPGNDKTNHLIAYAALVFPLSLQRPKRWWLYIIFFIAYSGAIEIVQPYFQRYCELLDLVANIMGMVCGLLIATVLRYVFPAITHHSR